MEPVFLFKKLISRLIFPLPLTLQMVLLGLVLLVFGKRKAGFFFVFLGAGLLGGMAVEPVADRFLQSIEQQYQPINERLGHNVPYVVVLGGGHDSQDNFPPTSQLGSSSLSRVVEGVRMAGLHPEAQLIFSGGRINDPVPHSQVAALAALQLGVEPHRILTESEALDTEDEARAVKEMVSGKPFILVTSASHMPRAMQIFRYHGMNPVPSPADYLAREKQYTPWSYFPSARGLEKMERVFYERLGLAWASIRGIIPAETVD
ncbi:envelope biogenesis factor ElyC [Desulfonatronovibrio hydrogenovorans]|uniref:envelope biogenesis factor ElyC n=1 Tax=Desulfonatronovibrio hydrogenovorans TaxID=53245 RepID=UPI00048D6BAF|nr:envelope biogenesis factor ElyC [Desulfonatronovibrio hydrogenovorans]